MEEIAQAVNEVDAVTGFDKYQGNRADVVVYFNSDHGVQALRAEMLRNYREAFSIVDYKLNGDNSYAQLKAK